MCGHRQPSPTPARQDRHQSELLLTLAPAPSFLELRFDSGDEAPRPGSHGTRLWRLSSGHNADLALRCSFQT